MHKKLILVAGISGALAVALGAFGAHGLQKLTTDEKILHGYQTGVQYHVYHTLALLATAILLLHSGEKKYTWAARFFLSGLILFSGSLYLITWMDIKAMPVPVFLRIITPLGGLLFILGWLMLSWAALAKPAGRDKG